MRELSLQNRQRQQPLNLTVLRQMIRFCLDDLLGPPAYKLSIQIVSARVIGRINCQFLRQSGPTDVIAFDYRPNRKRRQLFAEILVCLEVAKNQAARFHTSWQSELVRYIIHGILHLLGLDDQTPAQRRKMKQQEHRILTKLARQFSFRQLGRGSPRRACP